MTDKVMLTNRIVLRSIMPLFKVLHEEDKGPLKKLLSGFDGVIQLAVKDSDIGAYLEFKNGGLDVIQPDVCRAGGITESLKMAEVADLYGAACAPHVSIGSAIQFAATSQLALALPNLLIAEHWIGDNPLGDAILTEPMPQPEDGYLTVADGPGLGIEIDEARVRELAVPKGGAS